MTKRKPQWWYGQKGTLDCRTIEPLATRRVHDIMERDVEWLWRDVIPLRKLTLIAGEPGVGKSLLTLDIAARVSTGGTFPAQQEPCRENSVLLISSEDDADGTIKPRLRAAGAELDMIYCVDGTRFNLDKDVDSLEVTAVVGRRCDHADMAGGYRPAPKPFAILITARIVTAHIRARRLKASRGLTRPHRRQRPSLRPARAAGGPPPIVAAASPSRHTGHRGRALWCSDNARRRRTNLLPRGFVRTKGGASGKPSSGRSAAAPGQGHAFRPRGPG